MYLKDTNYGNQADESENYDRCFEESQVEKSTHPVEDSVSVGKLFLFSKETGKTEKKGM